MGQGRGGDDELISIMRLFGEQGIWILSSKLAGNPKIHDRDFVNIINRPPHSTNRRLHHLLLRKQL
jgi:hypothetical protein